MENDNFQILRSLWNANIKSASIESTNIEEIQEQVNDLKVNHIVMLKDNEHGVVRVRSWDKDRFQEKSFATSELIENMQRIIKSWNEGGHENMPLSVLSRSESKTHLQEANVDVLYVTTDKISSNSRRKYDNQIRSQLDSLFKKLTGLVVILALSIDVSVIRTLISYLEFENEYMFQKSIGDVIDRHPRHKKYLQEVCDEIYDQRTKRKNPTIVLYSLLDYSYKVIF